MDPKNFVSSDFGRVTKEPGNKHAFWYFQPDPIPRELSLAPATVRALSEADAALGQLHGLSRLVKDPELLVGPYLTREALASSRIEGTEASLSDVLRAEVSQEPTRDENILEVERYLKATRLGLQLVKRLPITQRLVCELHSTLLDGGRGAEKLPGEFRRSPVWVGSATASPDTATFVPPLAGHVPDLIDDWERFVNEPSLHPPLVQAALMHYQFETIHPFLDGNGRIGRLLVGLMLMESGRLEVPLLYLSGYLESNRREYYDRLQAVRERGEIQQWLQFFLTAVRRQADDGVLRASRLVEIRESYLASAAHTRSKLAALADVIFTNPFVAVVTVQQRLDLTDQTARNLIKQAERLGWLEPLGRFGRGGRTYWVAREVFDVIDAPVAYAAH